nr:unnamed protein product [Digitaria exilis]
MVWRSSSRSRPNVGGARSAPTPLDAARTTANRGGFGPGRLLHPASVSGGRSGGATGSGATAKGIISQVFTTTGGRWWARGRKLAIAISSRSWVAPLRPGSGNPAFT